MQIIQTSINGDMMIVNEDGYRVARGKIEKDHQGNDVLNITEMTNGFEIVETQDDRGCVIVESPSYKFTKSLGLNYRYDPFNDNKIIGKNIEIAPIDGPIITSDNPNSGLHGKDKKVRDPVPDIIATPDVEGMLNLKGNTDPSVLPISIIK